MQEILTRCIEATALLSAAYFVFGFVVSYSQWLANGKSFQAAEADRGTDADGCDEVITEEGETLTSVTARDSETGYEALARAREYCRRKEQKSLKAALLVRPTRPTNVEVGGRLISIA